MNRLIHPKRRHTTIQHIALVLVRQSHKAQFLRSAPRHVTQSRIIGILLRHKPHLIQRIQSLVHPAKIALIAAQNAIKPIVSHLMHNHHF